MTAGQQGHPASSGQGPDPTGPGVELERGEGLAFGVELEGHEPAGQQGHDDGGGQHGDPDGRDQLAGAFRVETERSGGPVGLEASILQVLGQGLGAILVDGHMKAGWCRAAKLREDLWRDAQPSQGGPFRGLALSHGERAALDLDLLALLEPG